MRPASGGPTVRLQVPLLCSLQGFKDVLAPLISLPPLSFSLSLNKKDAIHGPGSALLSSFGVTSGDLLFYLVETGSGNLPLPTTTASQQSALVGGAPITRREVSSSVGASVYGSTAIDVSSNLPVSSRRAVDNSDLRDLCASAAARRATSFQSMRHPVEQTGDGLESSSSEPPCESIFSPSPIDIADDFQSSVGHEIVEAMAAGKGFDSFVGRRLPIPDLLQRVLYAERGKVRQACSYLILAVHAVMLETGFVRVEPGLAAAEGHELPPGWSSAGLVNLVYSLPDLLTSRDSESGRIQGEEALLRCQVVGNAVVVYGAVTGGTVHRLSLSVKKFMLEDAVLRTASDEANRQKDLGVEDMNQDITERSRSVVADFNDNPMALGFGNENHVFRDIFELWKDVKDSLSLPLLTVICEKAGLPPPPSLLRLPTELKIKVLDSLPAVALASLACVSSELRFLAASEDLWKQQYRQEFGAGGDRAPGGRGWKNAFVRDWENRRRREEDRREAERYFRNDMFPPGTPWRASAYPPHFGVLDYFQGMGGSSRRGIGGFGPDGGAGFRNYGFRGGPPGNPMAYAGNRAVGRLDFGFGGNRDDVGCFHSMDGVVYDGQGLRTWPSPNSLPTRGTRSLTGYGGGRGSEFRPRNRLDGDGDVGLSLGLGPYR